MLNHKVAYSGSRLQAMMLLSAILSTAVLATESQIAAPLKFKSVLAQIPVSPAKNDGFDSSNSIIYVNNDSPIGKYTLRAECDFNRAGKVIIEEHFSNELNGLTFDSANAGASATEAAAAALATRYLKVYIDGMNNLCPRSSYTLTFHQYNNVACKCKNVGALLNGATSIITESLPINSRGSVV